VCARLNERLKAEGAQVLTLRTIRPSMEDVFMRLAEREPEERDDA
jgi:hypothetical protein